MKFMNTTTTIQSIPNQYEIVMNNYAEIVERTNQQLSLWTNPYGLMVGLLTFLIAFLAIVVSFLLWKYSHDQKVRVEEFFSRQEKNIKEKAEIFDNMLKERDERARKYEESFNNLIQEYQGKLKNVNKENKKEIERLEKTIDELNRNKASVSSYKIPEVIDDVSSIYAAYGLGNPIHTMTCFGCGKVFQYKDKERDSVVATSFYNKNRKVYCPHCGAENFV